MFQKLYDQLMPEVAPGKFLYRGNRWGPHAFLIDANIRSQLIWVSRATTALLCLLAIFATIYLKQPGMEPFFYGSVLLGTAVVAGGMTGLSRWIVRRGERVRKSEIDPKFALRPFFGALLILEKLPRWVLWMVAILVAVTAIPKFLILLWAITQGYLTPMKAILALLTDVGQIAVALVCVYELRARRRKVRAA